MTVCESVWTVYVYGRVDADEDEYYAAKGESNILHYAQKFKLVLNPALTGENEMVCIAHLVDCYRLTGSRRISSITIITVPHVT